MLSFCSPSISCAAIYLLLRFIGRGMYAFRTVKTFILWSAITVLQFNAGVEPTVENIGKEVGEDDRKGDDQEDPLHLWYSRAG